MGKRIRDLSQTVRLDSVESGDFFAVDGDAYGTKKMPAADIKNVADAIKDISTIRTNASKGATAVQPGSLASVATSGSYNDLKNKPSIPSISGLAKQSDVNTALSAKQDKISDLATIRSGATSGSTAVQPSSLASVATSGSYNDLKDRPSIPSISGLAKQSDVNTALAAKQGTISDLDTIRSGASKGATSVQPEDLADVATSGSYNDLTDKPNIPSISGLAKQSDVTAVLAGKQDSISDLATIRSGASKGATAVQPSDLESYASVESVNTLSQKVDNLPTSEGVSNIQVNGVSGTVENGVAKVTIPVGGGTGETTVVQADWNAESGVSSILNKPDLSDVATSGSYNDLTDKPSIPSISGLASKTYVDTEVGKKQDTISDLATIRSGATAGSTAVQADDLSDVATSGSYNDLTDKPTIPSISGLASTTYVDTEVGKKQDTISDLSTIRNNSSKGATAVQPKDLSTVATSGSYNDLSDKPIIPTVSGLAKSSDVTTALSGKQDSISDLATIRSNASKGSTAVQPEDLADVATSGSYNDLTDKPTIPSVNGFASTTYVDTEVGKKQDAISDLAAIRSGSTSGSTAVQPEDLATVATSGSYNDLTDKPTIPATSVTNIQVNGVTGTLENGVAKVTIPVGSNDGGTTVVQADWNAESGVSSILNKPNFADVATSGSYNDLTDKPTIPSVTGLASKTYVDTEVGKKQDSINDLDTIRSGSSKGSTAVQPDDLATVATSGSYNDLTDTPTIPSIVGLAKSSDVNTALSGKQDSISDLATIRSGASKGATSVQADDLADVATSGSYNDLADKPSIPSISGLASESYVSTEVSKKQDSIGDLATIRSGASKGATSVQPEDLADVATSGSYNDLTDKPSIPSISGLAKSSDVTTSLAGKQDSISDLATIRSGASKGATAVQPDDLSTVATSGSYNDLSDKPSIPSISGLAKSSDVNTALSGKQDTISDLATIRSGATLGATAVQPDGLATVATSGSYNDLTDKPTTLGTAFTGATSTKDGTSGLVPAPTTDDVGKFLSSDGTFKSVEPYQLDDSFNTSITSDGRTRVSVNTYGLLKDGGGAIRIATLIYVSKALYESMKSSGTTDPNTLYIVPVSSSGDNGGGNGGSSSGTGGSKPMTTWVEDFSDGIDNVYADSNGWYDLDVDAGVLRAVLREPDASEVYATFFIDIGSNLDLTDGAYLSMSIKALSSDPNPDNAVGSSSWNNYDCFMMRLVDSEGNYSTWIPIDNNGIGYDDGINSDDGVNVSLENISTYVNVSTFDKSKVAKLQIGLIGWEGYATVTYKNRNKGVSIDNIRLSRNTTETAEEGAAQQGSSSDGGSSSGGTSEEDSTNVYRRGSNTYSFTQDAFTDASDIYSAIKTDEGDRVIFIVRHSERDTTSGKNTGINDNGLVLINTYATKLTGAPFADATTDAYYSTNVKRTLETSYFIGVNRGNPNTTQTTRLGSDWESNTAVDHSGDTDSSIASVKVSPGPHTYFNDHFTGGTSWPTAQYYYRDNKAICTSKCEEGINWIAEASKGHPFTFVTSHDLCMVPYVCWAADNANMFSTWNNDYSTSPTGWLNYMAGIAVIVHADRSWEVYPTKILNTGKFE